MLIHDVFLRLMVFLLEYISTFNTAHRLVKFARNMLIEQKQNLQITLLMVVCLT